MIYVIALDTIQILTCWAIQNDRQNLSFVKDTNVVGKKMAGNTCKMAISYLCHFRFETEFMCELTSFSLSYNIIALTTLVGSLDECI